MKLYTILFILLTISFSSFCETKKEMELRYSKLKYDFTKLDLNSKPIGKVRRTSYSSGSDKMPLFIAGGFAVISTVFIVTMNDQNYSHDKGVATTGFALGGLGMSGLFVAKYFIDKE